jgi:hypothetical protein
VCRIIYSRSVKADILVNKRCNAIIFRVNDIVVAGTSTEELICPELFLRRNFQFEAIPLVATSTMTT